MEIYVSGSCKNNPGNGGYAYLVVDELKNALYKNNGFELNTTNNRMELMSALFAINFIKNNYKDDFNILYSDSSYLVNCFNEKWIDKWQTNNWKTYDKKDVLNKDLWEKLNESLKNVNIKFLKADRNNKYMKIVNSMAKIKTI